MSIGGYLRRKSKAEIKRIKFGKKRKPLKKPPPIKPVEPVKTKRATDPLARAKRESQKRRNQIGIKRL